MYIFLRNSSANASSNQTTENIFNSDDISYSLASTIFLWALIPGCGLFYSGISRRGTSLSVKMVTFWSIAIVSIQWYVVGYSLAFSRTSSLFVGNFQNVFLRGIGTGPYPENGASNVPEMLFCFYQGVTATLAPAVLLGVVAERGRIIPAVVFILVWTTLGYDPIAAWSLNYRGWSARLGVLDFGGGAPVHVPAAAAALAYSLMLGPRLRGHDEASPPHNMPNLAFGTVLIWIGTFGNNSGSAFAGNMVGIMSIMVTNLSGSAGALTWVLIDYRCNGTLSAPGLCFGVVAGLICVIPAAGYISPTSSVIMGVVGAAASNGMLKVFTAWNKFEDTLDILSLHGTSGVVGNILTGVLAQKAYGGELVRNGGWLDGNWSQVLIQVLDTSASFAWSFGVAYVSLFIINRIPGLKLRVTPEVEAIGIDESEMGIKAYQFIGWFPRINNDKIGPLSIVSAKVAQIKNEYRIYPESYIP